MTMATSQSAQPQPPYYVVVFSSVRRVRPGDGYAETAARMEELARQQSGFLGIENATTVQDVASEHGEGTAKGEMSAKSITVSYWRDEDSIKAWKRNIEHLAAQKRGKSEWYDSYDLRVAKVERAYGKL